MKNELREKIARDLNITKFNKESIKEYNQRILYSALSMWVRSLLRGNSVKDFNEDKDVNIVFPDIWYIQSNLFKVSEAFLSSFECNSDWLDTESYNNVSMGISNEIIRKMIYLQEIGEVLERKLSPVPYRRKGIGEFVHEFGVDFFDKKYKIIGVSMWEKGLMEDNIEQDVVIPIGGINYISHINKNFPWTTLKITGNYEMFKVGVTRAYGKSWIIYNPNKIKDGIYLLRDANSREPGYMLIKKNYNQIESVALDPWYKEHAEIYRIMYALNAANGTPANFRIKNYGDYIVLYYASKLPEEEDRLIQSISWPYSTYHDNYSRIIPYYMWDIALKTITKLGAIITE